MYYIISLLIVPLIHMIIYLIYLTKHFGAVTYRVHHSITGVPLHASVAAVYIMSSQISLCTELQRPQQVYSCVAAGLTEDNNRPHRDRLRQQGYPGTVRLGSPLSLRR